MHLGIWGCWPRSPAQRDIGRAWSVGWSCLAPYWFRGVFEQRAIARTCLASFAGSFFRAGCYAGRRRWRARAQRACEKATLLSCPRRSERCAANRRCLLGFGSGDCVIGLGVGTLVRRTVEADAGSAGCVSLSGCVSMGEPDHCCPVLAKTCWPALDHDIASICVRRRYGHLETPESLDMVYTWYILGIYF